MQARIRSNLTMARRALDFAKAHPLTDGGFTAIVTRLASNLPSADALATRLADGIAAEQAAVATRAALKVRIHNGQLRRLVRVASLAAQAHPELSGQFVLPAARLANKPFVLAAQSLLAAATTNKDVLTGLGLGDTFVDELTASLQQFDAVTVDAAAHRADHVGARAELEAVTRSVVVDLRLLDTYYQAVTPPDADLLAAWESARNLGPTYHHGGTGGQAPPPAPAPAPAPSPDPVEPPAPVPPPEPAPAPVSQGDQPDSPAAQAA